MEPLRTAPEASSFVPIAEHQSRTPSSFHEGPPVLHYHSQRCKVVVLEGDLLSNPALNALRGEVAANGTNAQADGESEISIEDVDTWVGSEKFILYSPKTSTGISIPYPSISVHAIQRLTPPGSETSTQPEVQGLYMQIATQATPSEEDEEQCITITVIPPPQSAEELAQNTEDGDEPETPIQTLYSAVSACSNLHPDPVEPGDEEEDEEKSYYQLGGEGIGGDETGDGLPPPVDGSSGWITAENMHEFIDEEGNWIAEGEPPAFPLGPGAGNVHERENGEDEDAVEEEDETKWRRTD
ncbi:hypothetical protein N7478_007619 [Penicillium angulare]|uniref:uncharacterized protein n=1 Tax=Penicillium angulare TaxID=116970 RepID=UPI002541CC8F|nr:uncharacterized protein N7478_007619 [Penicillium angulare]KAJ5272494.1 hypothetical protein N7478_007619 [Penicillium angulare]